MKGYGFSPKEYPQAVHFIHEIISAKEHAVKIEDFDAAKALKLAEVRMKSLGQQLLKLEKRKQVMNRFIVTNSKVKYITTTHPDLISVS